MMFHLNSDIIHLLVGKWRFHSAKGLGSLIRYRSVISLTSSQLGFHSLDLFRT